MTLTLWVYLTRPNQSTQKHPFVWLGVMQQKVAILNLGKSVNFQVKLS